MCAAKIKRVAIKEQLKFVMAVLIGAERAGDLRDNQRQSSEWVTSDVTVKNSQIPYLLESYLQTFITKSS